jgi:hypothetical protein
MDVKGFTLYISDCGDNYQGKTKKIHLLDLGNGTSDSQLLVLNNHKLLMQTVMD